MAIVPYPVSPRHQQVSLQPRVAAQSNRSEFTGKRQAVDLGYSWWDASVQVAPMDLQNARAWRLFTGRVRGATNSFRIPVLSYEQNDGSYTVRAQGALTNPFFLATDGWPASATPLVAGDYVNVGNQLVMLDADVVTNGSGVATLLFHQPLRDAVTDNTIIETQKPFLLSAFERNAPALSLTLPHLQDGFSFSVMEAY